MKTSTVVAVVAASAAVLGVLYVVTRGAGAAVDAAKSAANAINPLNNENVFYGAASAIGDKLGDGPNRPLGVRLFEWLNPSAVAAENAALGVSRTSDEKAVISTAFSDPYTGMTW